MDETWPTKAIWTRATKDLLFLDTLSKRVREAAEHLKQTSTPEMEKIDPRSGARDLIFDVAPATLLLIKLCIVVGDTVDALVVHHDPGLNINKLKFSERLDKLEEIYPEVDFLTLQELRVLRNQSAHHLIESADWEQFDYHYSQVFDFIASLDHKLEPPTR